MIRQKSRNSLFLCVLISFGCESQRTLKFATSKHYMNLKILTNKNELYPPIRITKESSLTSATMECALACGANNKCLAFNFYEGDESYVCEIVPDNLCTNKITKAFVPQTGGRVWDKLDSSITKPCIETLVSSGQGIPCNFFRPGCLGTWPNCSDCTKTCIDCNSRSLPNCVMWPDGSGQDSVPILGQCVKSNTILMVQNVVPNTGKVVMNYQMAPYDMHRIYRLNAYKIFHFYFENGGGVRRAQYRNWAIDAKGTLANLTYLPVQFDFTAIYQDILALNGKALKPTPFVEVTDDREGCGSFWLLNPTSPIYCPGGKTGLLGTPKLSGTTVVSTGIKCSLCNWGGLVEFGTVELLVAPSA